MGEPRLRRQRRFTLGRCLAAALTVAFWAGTRAAPMAMAQYPTDAPPGVSSADGGAIRSFGSPIGGRPLSAPTRPPAAPTNAQRPRDWPGGAPSPIPGHTAGPVPQRETAANDVQSSELVDRGVDARTAAGDAATKASAAPTIVIPESKYESTDVVARVGNEVILAGEILPQVNDYLRQVAESLVAQGQPLPPPEEFEKFRELAFKQRLPKMIEAKLLYLEARRSIPAENYKKIEERLNESFQKEQLKRVMEMNKVKSRTELEYKLRALGTSIEAQRIVYYEQSLGYGYMNQHIREDKEVTHEEMVAYYREHHADYETEPRAKWEHMMVKFAKHDSKAEAYAQIAKLGNLVLQGASFAETAKKFSDDASAPDGGLHDWTTKGSLVSAQIDDAIFRLPVGQFSQILEDERGFHIVRVVELQDLTRQPFTEVQKEIKDKIKTERYDAQVKAYIDKIRAKTPVWNRFDESATAQNPASGAAARR